MPIYEYKCKTCNFEFELLLFPGEDPICPKCNSKNLDKKISLVRIGTSSAEGTESSEGNETFEESGPSQESNEDFSDNNSSSKCSTCSGGDCSTCR